MRRGDVVIIAQKGVYEGKPRPAIVIQSDDLLADHPSILVCLLTTSNSASGRAFYRIPIEPNPVNGLKAPSIILADKLVTVRRANIGKVIDKLEEAILGRLNSALALFQGLT